MVVRFLSYVALYAAIAIMLSIYMPDIVNVFALVVGVCCVVIAARLSGRFERRVYSVYGSLSWSSGLFLLFFLTYYAVYSGDVFVYILYLMFLLLGLGSIGVIGAKDYRAVLQNVSVKYIALGVVFGVVTAWFAYAIPCSIAPTVGFIGSASIDPVTILILMMFIVAIPEEFMGRIFAFHVGAVNLDLYSGAIASVVLGYALHAITRYSNLMVLAVVTVVWALITAFYAYTRNVTATVVYHTIYNVVVICSSIYGVLPVFYVTLPIVIGLAAYVVRGG